MMLAQPAPEANLNAGEQYSVMQLLRRELLLCFTKQDFLF